MNLLNGRFERISNSKLTAGKQRHMNIIHNGTKNVSKLYANIFESIENFPNWADWLIGKFVFSK